MVYDNILHPLHLFRSIMNQISGLQKFPSVQNIKAATRPLLFAVFAVFEWYLLTYKIVIHLPYLICYSLHIKRKKVSTRHLSVLSVFGIRYYYSPFHCISDPSTQSLGSSFFLLRQKGVSVDRLKFQSKLACCAAVTSVWSTVLGKSELAAATVRAPWILVTGWAGCCVDCEGLL